MLILIESCVGGKMARKLEQEELLLQEEIKGLSLDEVGTLLKYARRLRKTQSLEACCKIAVLGSCSIQYFVQVLRLLLYREGIYADFYEGEYDSIRTDVLDKGSGFYQFRPDIVLFLTDYRDIKEFPRMFDSKEQVERCIAHIVETQTMLWESVHQSLPECQIIMSNYVIPVERMLGNLECNYTFSRQSIYRRLNEELVSLHPQYVLLADMEYLASIFGKLNWFDMSAYLLTKIPFALKYVGYVADLFAKLIAAYRGIVKKCIVLDLDNTLWGGVVSEVGARGIRIDPNDAVGEAFLLFQKYLKNLKERGIILAVCSKNDEKIAKEPFLINPDMILKQDDFAAFYANWDDKATNICRIAQEIGIGLNSLVFFDDNPAERELVRMKLPEVAVVDVPAEAANYVKVLEMAGYFHWVVLTPEDKTRTETYAANKKRDNLLITAKDYNLYLQQLSMSGSIQLVSRNTIRRFSQLVNKSNQFNLRTKRYTEAELSDMMKREDCKLLTGSLSDKFSNYGVISCVILQKKGLTCFIDTWVMSCRVLKRGFEYLFFSHIVMTAREWGCEVIEGEFIPTEKNNMVRMLLPELGFQPENVEGQKFTDRYIYDVQTKFQKEFFISEEEG